ncbi:hypothetical protein IU438_07515 [Nocardia cyriacigeorgica]|uniref:DUF6414 family protein n=1 Tax=Nocardia cyriacigeorgica TaxID=135487 RepID=UPI001894E7EF|nr:hypothetical protein [Nocardia cyriacigeorgica]MBF6395636.1 hypothetical protein [Nocardia cyriacigeorgica]MBF6401268.1 hypothetical protein [Nocardia cyriacigeorgica]
MGTIYQPPAEALHRGFFYLNDELVTNSLSSLEAGQVDDVVSKAVIAREGGGAFGGGLSVGAANLKGDYSKKGSTTMEESLTKTRTRFSIFQIWYDLLRDRNALGAFRGWGPEALKGVEPGHTLVIQAAIDVVPIYAMLRMFLWYSGQVASRNPLFGELSDDDIGQLGQTADMVRFLLGGERNAFSVLAEPRGNRGPAVGMELDERWIIGGTRSLGGIYTIVGQVHRVLASDEWMQTLRLIDEGVATTLEREIMREAISNFIEPAKAFDMTVRRDDGEIHGPALWLEPIAIFR